MTAPLRVRVCRDCCCGTPEKHPDVDHDGLLDGLVEATRGYAEVAATTCLLACEWSNVVVVSPGSIWFKEMLSEESWSALADWIRAGGPGTQVPEVLVGHLTNPALAAVRAGSR